jgi:hypothetical protein
VIKTPARTQQPHRAGSESQESLERAFAHKLTQRLGGQDPALGAQVERRLSAARWQAVEAATRARRARVTARAAALATSSGPGVFSVWWVRLASFVPPLALTLGLIGIDQLNLTQRIEAAAEVDAALLADDLPPTAYTDPGFAEFIKQPQRPAGP